MATTPAVPTTDQLDAACAVVADAHPRTALYPAEWLMRDGLHAVHVKYENHGPVRTFKARGALARVAALTAEERERGVVTASTGNHGQAIAWAARRLGVAAAIVVPQGTSPMKLAAIERFGGVLRDGGENLAAATDAAREIAARERLVFVEDGDDPHLMAGAATVGSELLDALPDVGTIVVPVGGGNLIAGVALAVRERGSRARVIGVQSVGAPAVARSLEQGRVVEAPCETFAGGLATSYPGALAFAVIRDHVERIVLVEEDELRDHVVRLLESAGQVAEGAGAAAFAALARHGAGWREEGPVALILSGGNFDTADLRELLAARAG